MRAKKRERVCMRMCIFVCASSYIFMRICAIVWAYARHVYMYERRKRKGLAKKKRERERGGETKREGKGVIFNVRA